MGRRLHDLIPTFALIAVLVLAHGCKEKEQLEHEAPALAHANLKEDRIAIAGVVSGVPALGDSDECRASRSLMMGDHLGLKRFGKLPIVSYSEVQAILGADQHGVMLDRFKEDGVCDGDVLVVLKTALEGKARFLVFANIQDDQIEYSDSESEVEDKKAKTTTKTKTMTTSRTTAVRLCFYDLADQTLAWDHMTFGQSANSKDHDMSDVIQHDPHEGFLGGLVTSIANSVIKGDPRYPAAPRVETCLANAFDNTGVYLKPGKKK